MCKRSIPGVPEAAEAARVEARSGEAGDGPRAGPAHGAGLTGVRRRADTAYPKGPGPHRDLASEGRREGDPCTHAQAVLHI